MPQAEPAFSDAYSPYEAGLLRLLEKLGPDHPRYPEALAYEQRLRENIGQSRQHGDTETLRAERSRVALSLNELAMETVGLSFNQLCGRPQASKPLAGGAPNMAPSLPRNYVPREAELAELRANLLGSERQVAEFALRGMGGVGKTTLATALCHDQQVIDAFPDGILWATLGPQADLFSAQASWGQELGYDLSNLPDVKARAARLRSLLRNRRCLLVIDDVWDTAHLELMRVGERPCATLVTTRMGKVAQRTRGTPHTVDVLNPAQAIRLLEEWAGEIAEAERELAEELARRLGYLPLALALVGAQAEDGEPWGDLLAAFRDAQGDLTLLDLDDLDDLSLSDRRAESLELTFDLSVERLGDALSERFAMLGVFAAGREAPFTAEAAAAVWELKPIQAKKILARLVRAALLNRDGDAYSLHLLLGDYARGRLDEATRRAAETRHSAHYLEVVRRGETEWETAEAALPQIRTAWGRLEKEDAEGLYTWALAGHRFLKRRELRVESIAWIEAALSAVRAAGQRQREGWCEHELGVMYFRMGQLDQALGCFKSSLAIRQAAQDRIGEAETLNYLGQVYQERGELDAALEQHQTSLAISLEMDHQLGQAQSLHHIAHVHHKQGDLDTALEKYRALQAMVLDTGSRGGESWLLYDIGRVYHERDELNEALDQYRASLTICREVGIPSGEAEVLWNMGRAYEQLGRLAEAEEHMAGALALYEAMSMHEVEEVGQDLERVRGRLGSEEKHDRR